MRASPVALPWLLAVTLTIAALAGCSGAKESEVAEPCGDGGTAAAAEVALSRVGNDAVSVPTVEVGRTTAGVCRSQLSERFWIRLEDNNLTITEPKADETIFEKAGSWIEGRYSWSGAPLTLSFEADADEIMLHFDRPANRTSVWCSARSGKLECSPLLTRQNPAN